MNKCEQLTKFIETVNDDTDNRTEFFLGSATETGPVIHFGAGYFPRDSVLYSDDAESAPVRLPVAEGVEKFLTAHSGQ